MPNRLTSKRSNEGHQDPTLVEHANSINPAGTAEYPETFFGWVFNAAAPGLYKAIRYRRSVKAQAKNVMNALHTASRTAIEERRAARSTWCNVSDDLRTALNVQDRKFSKDWLKGRIAEPTKLIDNRYTPGKIRVPYGRPSIYTKVEKWETILTLFPGLTYTPKTNDTFEAAIFVPHMHEGKDNNMIDLADFKKEDGFESLGWMARIKHGDGTITKPKGRIEQQSREKTSDEQADALLEVASSLKHDVFDMHYKGPSNARYDAPLPTKIDRAAIGAKEV